MLGDGYVDDSSTVVLEDHKDIEQPKRDRRHDEDQVLQRRCAGLWRRTQIVKGVARTTLCPHGAAERPPKAGDYLMTNRPPLETPCLPATQESAVFLRNSAVPLRAKFSQPSSPLAAAFPGTFERSDAPRGSE